VVNHLQSQSKDHQTENNSQNAGLGRNQNMGAQVGAEQHPEHDRHDDARNDVAPAQIDAGTGRCGHSDHEVAGGGRYLEGDSHGLVHGQHLERSRADSEQAGENAGADHQAKTQWDAMHMVRVRACWTGIGRVEPEPAGDRVRPCIRGRIEPGPTGQISRHDKNDAKDDGNGPGHDHTGEIGAKQGTQGGADFQQHADADVGKPLFHIGGGRPG